MWARLVYIFDVLTLSSPRDRGGAQAPLGNVQINDGMPVVDLGGSPTVGAPKRGRESFDCTYPTMKGYRNCHGPGKRDCWLESIQNSSDRYDINSNYELVDRIPIGETRKVSHSLLAPCSTKRRIYILT